MRVDFEGGRLGSRGPLSAPGEKRIDSFSRRLRDAASFGSSGPVPDTRGVFRIRASNRNSC